MKPWIRLLALSLASLPILSTVTPAQDFREEFTSVTPTNFDGGGEVSRQFHLNAESYLRMSTVFAPDQPSALEVDEASPLAEVSVAHKNGTTTFAEYVAQDPLIDGVIVLHDGRIAFEAYPNMQPHQRHFSWSVSKIVASTALAALADQGRLDMDARVEEYLPELAGTAWSGTPVRDIADMASGIDCLDSDGYQDSTTCIYTLEESLGITAPTERKPDFIEHLRAMDRLGQSGAKYEYVSANTNVLALLIERVTGKQYSEALGKLLWRPIGAEADAMMAISSAGFAYASGGLHARLRDIARLGQVYIQPCHAGVLSAAKVREIQGGGVGFTEVQAAEHRGLLSDDLPVRAGWQWDMIWADGAMYKSGYSGQGLYVDPSRKLVAAWFGTGLGYDEVYNEMLSVSRQLARSLD